MYIQLRLVRLARIQKKIAKKTTFRTLFFRPGKSLCGSIIYLFVFHNSFIFGEDLNGIKTYKIDTLFSYRAILSGVRVRHTDGKVSSR